MFLKFEILFKIRNVNKVKFPQDVIDRVFFALGALGWVLLSPLAVYLFENEISFPIFTRMHLDPGDDITHFLIFLELCR